MSVSLETQKRRADDSVALPDTSETSETSAAALTVGPRKLRKLNKRIAKIIKTERSQTPLDTLSSAEEPLAQEDVLYFQKEAIYRLLQLQYRKNALLTSTLDTVHHRYSRILLCNSVLVHWWFQILDNLKTLFHLENGAGDASLAALNDNLLLSLITVENDSNEGSNDEFVTHIKNNLATLQKGLSSVLATLVDKSPHTPTTDQVLALQNEITSVKVLRTALAEENTSLREELANAKGKIEDLQRRYSRETSKSVQRVRNTEAPVNTEVEQVKEEVPVVEIATVDDGQQTVDRAKIEDLEVQLAELSGRNETLLIQLEEKSKKVAELERSSVTSVHVDSGADSDKFKEVVEEAEKLRAQLEEAVSEKRKLESELFEIESKISRNQAKMESKVRSEIEANQTYVEKLEKDLTRIRNDRDALTAKVSVLRTEKDKSDVAEDYSKLVNTLETRVKELEDVEQKLLSAANLEDRESILVNELKQVEAAFRDVREVASRKLTSAHEQEQHISKLAAEKAKAEEKYFQAMRAKDALSSQNKVLQASVAKQMDLIDLLRKKESELHEKLNIEEKLYTLVSKVERVHVTELGKVQSQLRAAEKELVHVRGREKDLRGEVSKREHDINMLERDKLALERDLAGVRKSMKQMKELVTKYRGGGTVETRSGSNNGGGDAEVQEALLSMTKCSLCNKNFKNVALKTCGHCFCKECVDDRLAARMRKCPSCNCQFSQYDVLGIHL